VLSGALSPRRTSARRVGPIHPKQIPAPQESDRAAKIGGAVKAGSSQVRSELTQHTNDAQLLIDYGLASCFPEIRRRIM
jgi:hypothetical protein